MTAAAVPTSSPSQASGTEHSVRASCAGRRAITNAFVLTAQRRPATHNETNLRSLQGGGAGFDKRSDVVDASSLAAVRVANGDLKLRTSSCPTFRTAASCASWPPVSAAATSANTIRTWSRGILGHENVGVIEKLGETAAARWGLEVGRRFALGELLAVRPLRRLPDRRISRMPRNRRARGRGAALRHHVDESLAVAVGRLRPISTWIRARSSRACRTASTRASR